MLNVCTSWKNCSREKKRESLQKKRTNENIRDYATIKQLLVLANSENKNTLLIEQDVLQGEYLKQLNTTAYNFIRQQKRKRIK